MTDRADAENSPDRQNPPDRDPGDDRVDAHRLREPDTGQLDRVVDELAWAREQLAGIAAAVAEVRASQADASAYQDRLTRNIHLIDELHRENTTLRAGELATAMKPLYLGLIRLYFLTTPGAGDDTRSVEMLHTQIEQILELNHVTTAVPAEGSAFDPSWQNGAETVPTDEEELSGRVARIRKAAFLLAGSQLLQPAEVDVYRFTAAATSRKDR